MSAAVDRTDAERGRVLVNEVAADAERDLEDLIEAIVQRLRVGTPDLFTGSALAHALRAASAANIRRVHRLLSVPQLPVGREALPDEAHELTTACIRHGVALVELLEAWRIGQAFVSDWWRHRVEERAGDRSALVAAVEVLQTRISVFADAATAEVRRQYEQERRSWDGSPAARRLRLVRELLDEEDQESQRAGVVLNYPLGGWHTAAVLWRVGPADRSSAALDETLGALSRRLDGAPTLCVPLSGRTAWVWTTAGGGADWPRDLPPGTRLALGTRLQGLAGFRRSHTEALEAQRIAGLSPRSTRAPVRYAEVEVAALMSRHPDDMWWFIHRTLGPLAVAGPSPDVLRATLAAYLDSGGSATAAARVLHVHRNTVAYRMDRIADVLGDAVAERATELAVALRLVDVLGPLAADGEPSPSRDRVVGRRSSMVADSTQGSSGERPAGSGAQRLP